MARSERQTATGAPPRLALIADGFTDATVADRVSKAVGAGIRWVHLRDHDAAPGAFADAAQRLADALRTLDQGVRITVNGHLSVAARLGAGLHTGARGPTIARARDVLGPEALLGYSSHAPDEARAAIRSGANYVFFSPVFPTPSKPDHPGAGLNVLRQCCAATPGPVLALGGITPNRVARCCAAGAQGVAVLSGILHAGDPAAAATAYLEALASLEPLPSTDD